MFRTCIACVAAAFLAVGITPLLPATAARADTKQSIDLCRDVLLPARPNSNLGECLSYINVATNQSGGEPSHACDFLIENDPDTFDLMFTSRSECIQAFGLRGPWKVK